MSEDEIELLQSMDYEDRSVVVARSGTRWAWVGLSWEGEDPEHPYRLPSGRDLHDVLEAGELEALAGCWITVVNTGRYGDMLWSTGPGLTLVSDRFIEALDAAGIGGFQRLALQVAPKRGERFDGYWLLLPDNADPNADVRSFPYFLRARSNLDLSAAAMSALRAADIRVFETMNAREEAESLITSDREFAAFLAAHDPAEFEAQAPEDPQLTQAQRDTLRSLDYRGRTVVAGRNGVRQASASLCWIGQDVMTVLPDGRDTEQVLGSGDLDSLPHCWINVWSNGTRGDMIFAPALESCFVSDRFANALLDAGIGGFRLLPLEGVTPRDEWFAGYALLLPDNDDPNADVRSFPFFARSSTALDLSARAWAVLKAAGVTALVHADAAEAVAELLDA